MGLSLVRSALKNSALGRILESRTQEHLISAIEQGGPRSGQGTASSSEELRVMSSARASIGRLQSMLSFIPDGEPEPEAAAAADTTAPSGYAGHEPQLHEIQ